jgi:hypothetical protein
MRVGLVEVGAVGTRRRQSRDFRKDNGAAIRETCRQFVALCRNLNLFIQAIVAIDGSRFKAVKSRDRSFSRGSIERRVEQIEASIDRYLSALETADRQEGESVEAKTARLKDKIGSLRDQMKPLGAQPIAPRRSSTFSATRQALAMIVNVGLAPVPVGNGAPSTT